MTTLPITLSEKANKEYVAKIFKLENVEKHPNADNLSIVYVDNQPIISNNPSVGSWYVYCPPESKLNEKFLSFSNSFRDNTKNINPEKSGFFENNCRVKTIKLRGSYSLGYIFPLSILEEFIKQPIKISEATYFDQVIVDDKPLTLIQKYRQPYVQVAAKKKDGSNKINICPDQFQFHEDTENLRRNIHKLNKNTPIHISYKLHGSSFIVGNLLFKKQLPLPFYKKILNKVGFNFSPKEKLDYEYIASSRRVIRTVGLNSGFYDYDIWTEILNTLKEDIPEGYTLYGEVVGYLPDGQYIQSQYDYKCEKNTYKLYLYRITITDKEGDHTELSPAEIKEFSNNLKDKYSDLILDYSDQFKDFTGTVEEHVKELTGQEFTTVEDYLTILQNTYNEKDCILCKNKVPEEGIVLRVLNSTDRFEAYKLKSFRFLGMETQQADKGISSIEDEN